MSLRTCSLSALLAWLALLLAAPSGSAHAEQEEFQLRPFTAVYEGRYGVLSGSLTLSLEHVAGDEWVLTSTLSPRGLARGLARLLGRRSLEERTRLRVTEDGILPLTYRRTDGISGPDRDASLLFLYAEGRLVGTDRDEEVDLPLEGGEALDRLSVQLQLMHDLTLGERREEYWIVDRAELREMDVIYVEGVHTVRAAGREFETLALDHRSRSSNRSTRLWCASEYQYLPVRIEQTRGGSVEWSGVLSEVRWGEPPAELAHEPRR